MLATGYSRSSISTKHERLLEMNLLENYNQVFQPFTMEKLNEYSGKELIFRKINKSREFENILKFSFNKAMN